MTLCIEKALCALARTRADLEPDFVKGVFSCMLSGRASSEQIAGFLVGLEVKGIAKTELVAAIETVRAQQRTIRPAFGDGIDIGGTGGDCGQTFNVSTVAAIVAAAAGVRVIKHGSRAASGRCGSVDLVAGLGLETSDTKEAMDDHLRRFRLAVLDSRAF